MRVQHHHAHVAACMAEHRLAGPVLGLSWDGVGYGGDGTIWGGEALVCEGDEFIRAAHLRTFPLPGGDLAMRQPRRAALGLLYEILGDAAAEHLLASENTGKASATQAASSADWFTAREIKTLFAAMARSVNSPRASSMGRLFDGVAALVGLPQVISFEGEAAMALEFAADEIDGRRLSLAAHSGHCRSWPIGSRWCAACWPIAPRASPSAASAPASTTPWPNWPWRRPNAWASVRWRSPAAAFKTHG